MEQYALITGATSGLGLAYARRFAQEGYNLIITGRRKEIIEKRAGEIRAAYGCRTEVILVDLAQEAGVRTLLEALPGKNIDVLVNNAGFGLRTEFADTDIDDLKRLIFLETTAVTEITHYVLAGMKERGTGRIINISSDGAFAVVPKNVIYASVKRFLVTLTQGLHLELAGSGIRVQVVCPGFIDTDFHESAGMHVDKARKGIFAFQKPEDVVEAAMKDLAKGRVCCIPDRGGKLIKALGEYLPEKAYYRFAGGFVKKAVNISPGCWSVKFVCDKIKKITGKQ